MAKLLKRYMPLFGTAFSSLLAGWDNVLFTSPHAKFQLGANTVRGLISKMVSKRLEK